MKKRGRAREREKKKKKGKKCDDGERNRESGSRQQVKSENREEGLSDENSKVREEERGLERRLHAALFVSGPHLFVCVCFYVPANVASWLKMDRGRARA